jgi:DNA modification methylase
MILCDLPYGTTAIACINTNRNYIGFELSEEYCINKLGCGKVLDYIGVDYSPLPK